MNIQSEFAWLHKWNLSTSLGAWYSFLLEKKLEKKVKNSMYFLGSNIYTFFLSTVFYL